MKELLSFLGHATPDAIKVYTDNKAAYDLCHRYTSAQNTKHIERRMFKMRELRGAGVVDVVHLPGDANPADMFTKVLSPQVFEKHRKFVLNLPGDTSAEFGKRVALRSRSSSTSSSAPRAGVPPVVADGAAGAP